MDDCCNISHIGFDHVQFTPYCNILFHFFSSVATHGQNFLNNKDAKFQALFSSIYLFDLSPSNYRTVDYIYIVQFQPVARLMSHSHTS
jgi:hypothetical protein